jgi:hypothetical protein
MSAAEQETELLKTIVPKLEAEGYAVHVHPPKDLLPDFMQSYLPDAIALGSPKNLAIEVVVEGSSSKARLATLKDRFRNAKDWDLRIYYAHPVDDRSEPGLVSSSTIEESLSTIRDLIKIGQRRPALLMSWATFEAIGRALFPETFVRPQTPGRLVEVLAADGHLLPNEADVLRELANHRNRLIHGKLDINVALGDLEKFVGVLEALAERLRKPPYS